MKCVSIAFAIAAFVVGMVAAVLWWMASAVKVKPVHPDVLARNSGDMLLVTGFTLDGLIEAGNKSAKLNRWAAGFTAIAVALSTASALVAAFNT